MKEEEKLPLFIIDSSVLMKMFEGNNEEIVNILQTNIGYSLNQQLGVLKTQQETKMIWSNG